MVQVPQTELSPSANPSPNAMPRPRANSTTVILVLSLGAFLGLFFMITISVLLRSRKVVHVNSDEEDYLDHVPGMPKRFTYEELRAATENFVTKLGQGGFGSVFEGTLIDGTKVAVKCIDGVGQVKKSFLAEVQTIGGIR
ncbi:hypothetical protein IFM89_028411 [Coptis chinensis]|uniref:Protein kinase domain-containing protein n=1 Tax=Coptis chinensis TaxID=261450 RepID=A0A835IUG3_9MAGN|nr:hypothetical protein IFM89_028411 [Coptis chinensis]